MKWMIAGGLIALGLIAADATPASAESAMKLCGAKYQAAKAAGALPAGQTWLQFLSACRATLPKVDATAAPAGRADPAPPSAAQTGARTRVRRCADQYHADKEAGKLPAGQRWPQYYSACSARLKG